MSNVETLQDATVHRDDVRGGRAQANTPGRPPRKYVLFADGTGNAFTKQESNIWRLYEALDRTKPDQVAYYIKGVGTAGWAPLAALDGATGIGVPSNVRKLYRFLCWNWEPGDEIYVFGFSRGSFTARTLVGMISSQGLMPARIDDISVSHSEMERNTMAAWRAYRKATVGWRTLPTVWLARFIRDVLLYLWHGMFDLYHWIRPDSAYHSLGKAMGARRNAEIDFLGLFDTVEAFGVPIEEIRTAIDWAIWPISFRNGRLSSNVKRACHALALDDERVAFHPLRFEHKLDDPRITEVWFTGVHSDVGGGYPDGTLSFVPLVWMASHVEGRLRFQPGQIDHFKSYQSAIGPMHDSRSGAAVIYRYGPRPIGESNEKDGGPPIVHLAVVERMAHGCDDYAPVTLPVSARVLLPGGKVMALTNQNAKEEMRSVYRASRKAVNAQGQVTEQGAAAADAFTQMSLNRNIGEQVLDTVWWRRFWYFFLLASIVFVVAWPWAGKIIVPALRGPVDDVSGAGGGSLLDDIRAFDYGFAAITGPPARLLQGLLPSYAEPWFWITLFYPFATLVVIAVVGIAWQMNSFLRDRIQERARLAWNTPRRMVTEIGDPTPLLRVGRFMRLHAGWVEFLFAKILVPAVFLLIVFGAAFLAVGRSYFGWRDATTELKWKLLSPPFCTATKDGLQIVGELALPAKTPFETKNPCWSSGFWVEKDRKYRISITIKDPWFDRTIMTGVNGFQLSQGWQPVFIPFRRWISEDWFQPIARIGANADAEVPLRSIDGALPDKLPRLRDPTKDILRPTDKDVYPVRVAESDPPTFGNFEPIPPTELPAVQELWKQQNLASVMVADFTAAASGELFLYVNDAVQFAPFFGPFKLFYQNNSGSAVVTVQRMPLQPPKQ
jgi:uncharacterized protein (DUF2235 family)